MIKVKYRIVLIEGMLGTKAANKEVFTDYIASKAPDDEKRAEELETAEHLEESGTSVFHRQNDIPGIWDYQIKGFFKDGCGSLRRADGTLSKDLTAYKTKIDGLVFVFPRFIHFKLPEGQQIEWFERAMRVETPQGPRSCLSKAEKAPPGTAIEFEVHLLAKDLKPILAEWMNYGMLRGLGAWRNSGMGKFTHEEIAE